MKFEILPPDSDIQRLEERLLQLEQTLQDLQRNTSRFPAGRLRISQKVNHVEFYHVTSNADKIGTYLPRTKIELATQLAQKAYNSRLIKLLEKEIYALQFYIAQTEKCRAIQNLYDSLCKPRHKLITPITQPDEQYIDLWQSVEWQGRPFSDDTPELFTTKGERVRSKSEVLIADSLNRLNIPYRYEYPLKLKNGITVHPDFLCLNVHTRQEFYWEHFGIMNNPEYAENAINKLQQYSENNLTPGINFILTMESLSSPLNLKYIEQQIKAYLT